MDVKDLNKSQLLLLAVLLSFVTSIATGITTVTLMQQAPASFTAPVNRVIQQTVEKIQQVEGKTTVNTVVVKEEDLVVDAIAKNKSSVFAVTTDWNDDGGDDQFSAGNGFVVGSEGVIVADALWVPDHQHYFVSNESGKFKADFIMADKGGFSFLKIGEPVDATSKANFNIPTFGTFSKIKVGQKVIILGRGISSFIYDGSKDIRGSVSISKSNAGGMVMDLNGDVLGIALSGESNSFASIEAITSSLALNKSKF